MVRLEDLAVGYLPGRGALAPDGSVATEAKVVARAPFLAAQRGERIGIVGPNGAGKTTLLRTIAGDLPPLDGTITFGNAVQIGYLAQLRGAAIAGATVLDALTEAVPVTAGEARALPRPVPVPRRRRVQGGPDAVGRRALAARAGAARDPAVEPAPARRADEPPRHPGPRGDRGVHGEIAGDACWWCRTTGGCSRRCARSCGSWAMGRRWRSMAGIGSGGRRSRAAGRSRVHSSRRRRGCVAGAARPVARSRLPTALRLTGPVRARPPAASDGRRPPHPPQTDRKKKEKLSKEAYRREKAAAEGELTRLGLRKNHLELAMGDPAVAGEFRRDATGDERACGYRRSARGRGGRLARARGASAVTRPDRVDRSDRLRQVDGGGLARGTAAASS